MLKKRVPWKTNKAILLQYPLSLLLLNGFWEEKNKICLFLLLPLTSHHFVYLYFLAATHRRIRKTATTTTTAATTTTTTTTGSIVAAAASVIAAWSWRRICLNQPNPVVLAFVWFEQSKRVACWWYSYVKITEIRMLTWHDKFTGLTVFCCFYCNFLKQVTVVEFSFTYIQILALIPSKTRNKAFLENQSDLIRLLQLKIMSFNMIVNLWDSQHTSIPASLHIRFQIDLRERGYAQTYIVLEQKQH